MSNADAAPVAIFLMGPTATGKSELAIELVRRFPLEIVSVDSALVYRGMDIGTAKPAPELRAAFPHHLIDICDPTEAYSAGRFRDDARRAMDDVAWRGRIPLLVGGTMLYFRALERGLAALPTASPELRARIDRRAAESGWPALHAELARVDPESARRIHPNDPQRIQRALEVFETTGRTLSNHLAAEASGGNSRFFKIALMPPDRVLLGERIARRFRHMLDLGLIEEVRRLRARGDLNVNLPSMRAVGYRQAWEYLDGQYDEETMIERAVIATRQLAKRQMTWLRGESNLVTFDPLRPDTLATLVNTLQTIVGAGGNLFPTRGV
jgi:tRNA dimethylallyltransferase